MKNKGKIKETIIFITILISILLIKKFLYAPVLVNGDSMFSTLHDGDVMILNKIGYKINEINRFDIAVINHCEKDEYTNIIVKYNDEDTTYSILASNYKQIPKNLYEMYSFKDVEDNYDDEFMNSKIAKELLEKYRNSNIQIIDSQWSILNVKIEAIGINNTYLISYKKQFDNHKCTRLVKRVIGLPNDKIKYENNKLYINDIYIEEPFLDEKTYTEDLEFIIPKDYYYCLGDNRNISLDSRYLGSINIDEIEGTTSFTIFPFNRIGFKN